MNPNRMVWGTCDGTGAVINVCLGFIPKYVMLRNLEDSNSGWPSIEWMNPCFLAITNADEGVKNIDDTSQLHRTLLAADGISVYAGGDEITYDGATDGRWESAAAANVEEVYVDGHYTRDASADTAYKCIGDKMLGREPAATDNGIKFKTPPGFKIGVDADINADGEQLVWMAIG